MFFISKSRSHVLFLLFSLWFIQTSQTYNPSIRNNVFDLIAQDNLKTLTRIDNESDTLSSLIKHDKKFHQVLEETFREQCHLKPESKRRFVFTLLSQYEEIHGLQQSSVLDTHSWKDLEILSGPKSNLSYYVADKIDRTSTEIGRAIFYRRIIQPTNNKELLRKNQSIIKELTYNKNLFDCIDEELRKIKNSENIILSYWEEDIFLSILKQSELSVPYAPKLSKRMNHNTSLIEFLSISKFIGMVGSNLYMATGAISLPLMGIARAANLQSYDSLKKFNDKWGLGAMSILSVTGLSFYFLRKKYDNKWTDSASSIIGGPMGAVGTLYFGDQLRATFMFKKCLQKKLILTAQYINGLKAIALKTKQNRLLLNNFPIITNLDKELETLSEKSRDIKQLLGLLEMDTFKGRTSKLSLYGRMHVAYNLIHTIKNDLVHAMIAVGELDAYMSCARLVKEFQNRNVSFCFPDYRFDSETPYIVLNNFWNPALKSKHAIPNTIQFGIDTPQNIIVTGPNAGGKSTTIKGLILSVIMAQSLGIAPAESMTFTPFNSIMTYLNITDDIAAGNSHLKAGIKRAQYLLEQVQRQSGTNFSFTAIDEVFNGTTFEEGQAAAYALIEELGEYKNNMCVTVTHFPKVPLLEERTSLFTNYKVTIKKDNNKIIYPYTLEQGISHEAIALDILKEEGFNGTFLDKARAILNEESTSKVKIRSRN